MGAGGGKWETSDVLTFARLNQKTIIVQSATPTVMYAGMLWMDTDNENFYERNAANDGWITRSDHGALDGLTDDDHTQYLLIAGTRNWNIPDPAGDHGAEGITITKTAGENLAIGDLCYFKSDGKFWLADADAEATAKGQLALATAAISAEAAGIFLVLGKYRDDTWDWTVGEELFIHTTPGNPTATKPSGTGDIIRCIGHAHTADIMFFNPDQIYVEHR